MSQTNTLISTAICSVLAIGASGLSLSANADEVEKCYGVAKAGKNDCQTATSSCAGTSKTDGQKDAWVGVPKGTCEKLVNGSLESSAS